jgi:hypothetical protein
MVPPTMSLAVMHGETINNTNTLREYALKHVRTHSRGEKEGINF